MTTNSTDFANGTVVTKEWLNDVDQAIFDDVINIRFRGATESIDCSSIINSCIDEAYSAGGGLIIIPPGTWRCDSSIILKDKVNILGMGLEVSILDYRGLNSCFVANEAISHVNYRDFQITNASNTNTGVSAAVWNYGIRRSSIKIRYIAKAGDTADGFVVHGVQSGTSLVNDTAQGGSNTTITLAASSSAVDNYYVGWTIDLRTGTGSSQNGRTITAYNGTTKVATISGGQYTTPPDNTTGYRMGPANNHQYTCWWEIQTSADSEVTGTALKLQGEDLSNARCNAHWINGVINDFSKSVYVNGNGNTFGHLTVNAGSDAGIHIYGNQANNNTLVGTYLDSAVAGDKIRLESTGGRVHMLSIFQGVSDILPTQIVDASSGSNKGLFTMIANRRIVLPKQGAQGILRVDTNLAAALYGGDTTDLMQVIGAYENNAGRLILSGSSYAGNVNAIADAGSASLVLNNTANAQVRFVKTSDGNSYTRMYDWDIYGSNTSWGPAAVSAGDNKARSIILRVKTTNGTPTYLSNGTIDGIAVPTSGALAFTALIVAHRTDVDNESAAYELKGVIDSNSLASSTALVGSLTKTVIAEDTAAWDVTADADATNRRLRIQVTGEAAKNIMWAATITTIQVN